MALSNMLYFLFLVAPVAQTAESADMVNERIPVTLTEMEAHWQVDCRASWEKLVLMASEIQFEQRCELAKGLPRQLQLCAFIYQPPGEEPKKACPDYRGAHQLTIHRDCKALALFVKAGARCRDWGQ